MRLLIGWPPCPGVGMVDGDTLVLYIRSMPRASSGSSSDVHNNPYRSPAVPCPASPSFPMNLTESRAGVFWDFVFGSVVTLSGVALFLFFTCFGVVVIGVGGAILANAKWRAERTVLGVDEQGVSGYVNSSSGPQNVTASWKDIEALCLFHRSWLCLKVDGKFLELELKGLTRQDIEELHQAVVALCTKSEIDVMTPEAYREYNLARRCCGLAERDKPPLLSTFAAGSQPLVESVRDSAPDRPGSSRLTASKAPDQGNVLHADTASIS